MTHNQIRLLSSLSLLFPSYAFADAASQILDRNKTFYHYEGSERTETDRRNHAKRGKDDTNNGKDLANAIGTALTAVGVPMVASGVPTQVAIGSALLAKAALEFAQAAADNQVANQNGDQQNILKNDAGQNGTAYTATPYALANPDFQKLLSDRGIDPRKFNRELTNGTLRSPKQVLSALKETRVSADDLSQAEASADQKTAKIMTDATGAAGLLADQITYDNSHQAPVSTIRVGNTEGESSTKGEGTLVDQVTVRWPVVQAGKADSEESKVKENETKSQTPWESFFSTNSEGVAAEAKSIPGFLEKLGVQSPEKQNIFQIAHRNYRGFGHWRKQIKSLSAFTPVFAPGDVYAKRDSEF